jgi:four helix bundle protein
MSIRSYRDLVVWQEGMQLAKAIYLATERFPKQEIYGLISQLRRCSVSIPSNIAEGHARDSTLEYLRFISISMGSLAELETQVLLAKELDYLTEVEVRSILEPSDVLGKRLRSLANSLRTKSQAKK